LSIPGSTSAGSWLATSVTWCPSRAIAWHIFITWTLLALRDGTVELAM
jgi:hypothetical protein